MTTIPHRELRNHSSAILARVEAGESFTITNHGKAVARLSPLGISDLDRLVAEGQATSPTRSIRSLRGLARASRLSSKEILDDLRGAW